MTRIFCILFATGHIFGINIHGQTGYNFMVNLMSGRTIYTRGQHLLLQRQMQQDSLGIILSN